MMKDIFPFSQLGHALTHHYPIDLIHGFPSTSPYLPRPSTPIFLSFCFSSIYLCVHLPVDPCMLSHFSFYHTSHNSPLASHLLILSAHHFFHLPPLSFPPFLPPLTILTPLMHSIHLHIECLFFYIILPLCHSLSIHLLCFLLSGSFSVCQLLPLSL